MSRDWDAPRRLVIDASIAVKWYVPEIYTEIARQLLNEGNKLLAPDLIWAELGNVLVSKFRVGELSAEDVADVFRAFSRVPIDLTSSQALRQTAFDAARETRRSFYDCLYLALAVESGSLLVTAGRRFYNAIKATSWAPHCAWIEELA